MEAHCLGSNLFSDVNTYLRDAKGFYSQIGDPDDFERDVGTYLRDGHVAASPNWIIMGKAVRRDGGDPDLQWWDDVRCCDAWFVKFAAGEGTFAEWVKSIPYKLPFIGWRRALKDKPVRYWEWNKVTRRA